MKFSSVRKIPKGNFQLPRAYEEWRIQLLRAATGKLLSRLSLASLKHKSLYLKLRKKSVAESGDIYLKEREN